MRILVVLLTGVFLFLLISGYSLSMGMGDMPAAVVNVVHPQQVAINTPQFAPAGPWPTPPSEILPATASSGAVARGSSAAATPAGGAVLSLAVPQPAFAISPAVGTPGTQIAVLGQGWAPNDDIALRLQDPGDPQGAQPEFALATTDAAGNFRATFTIPAGSPWSTRPAILLWALSPRTGIQAALPQPFVIVAAPLPPGPQANSRTPGGGTATRAAQSTSTVMPTRPAPTATAGPLISSAAQSPLPTETPQPATGGSTFESPLAGTATPELTATPTEIVTETETAEATFGPESAAGATPAPETPAPSPSPAATVPTAGPTATSPGLLPRAGGELLRTATVTAAGTYMRLGPATAYRQVAVLPRGTLLGVVSRDGTGNWLQVTAPDGTHGWVLRAGTDLK